MIRPAEIEVSRGDITGFWFFGKSGASVWIFLSNSMVVNRPSGCSLTRVLRENINAEVNDSLPATGVPPISFVAARYSNFLLPVSQATATVGYH